jgi:serine/threonine protein kinase
MQKELVSNWICKGTCVGTPPFMSPEMLKKTAYDLNTDVYSMGCAFFEAMFWTVPRVQIMDIAALFSNQDILKLVDLPIKNNKDYYSKELVDIIYTMIEKDKNKRPNSEQILKMLIHEFNKKYGKNSGLSSVLSCLYSYQELCNIFRNNQQFIMQNSNTKQVSFSFLFGNKAINNEITDDWNNSLCSIRDILSQENKLFEGNKEIDP